MNEYNNVIPMYDRLVQTVAMTTLVIAFTTVYDANEISKKSNSDNSNRSNSRPTIEAIIIPEEKIIIRSCDVTRKKSSNFITGNYSSDAFTKKYHDKYSEVNTKTHYNKYLNSRY